MSQNRKYLAARIRQVSDDWEAEIDVARARKMDATEVKISNRQAHVGDQLTLDAEAGLLHVWLRIILRKQIDTRRLRTGRRRRSEDRRIRQTRIRHQSAVKRDAGYLNSIL